ncbi:unnamed protein product [Brassicogethes aeneus]|uniref:Acyltransferase n=1 Tax=Brassicogethes aeneus TaxID=1431903 RepID=A0A9P0BBL8_BRAAE|nr:unnamed protein product [Brassicogethes aeneus]
MNILGIQFAPLNVPMQRRLQTLAAAAWFIILAFGGFAGWGLTAYFILYTRLRWITLFYLGWMFFIDKDIEERGGRPSKYMKSLTWWKYLKEYFPFKLIKVEGVELDPRQNYLFCSFPHGMLSAGSFNAFVYDRSGFNEHFPHHQASVVTLAQHYKMPFYRDFGLSLGGISASYKSIDYVLKQPEGGRIAVLMVGGAAEAYYCKPGEYTFVLKKRKGFVKLAIRNGTPLVPVLNFGETDLFTQFSSSKGSWFHRLQEALRKYTGMAPIIPLGRGFFQYSFGLVPQRKPLTVVVGHPVNLQKNSNPTQKDIDDVHSQFIEALKALFDEQKKQHFKDPKNIKLSIV